MLKNIQLQTSKVKNVYTSQLVLFSHCFILVFYDIWLDVSFDVIVTGKVNIRIFRVLPSFSRHLKFDDACLLSVSIFRMLQLLLFSVNVNIVNFHCFQ